MLLSSLFCAPLSSLFWMRTWPPLSILSEEAGVEGAPWPLQGHEHPHRDAPDRQKGRQKRDENPKRHRSDDGQNQTGPHLNP